MTTKPTDAKPSDYVAAECQEYDWEAESVAKELTRSRGDEAIAKRVGELHVKLNAAIRYLDERHAAGQGENSSIEYPDAEQAWGDLPQDIAEMLQHRSFVAGYSHAGVEMEIARNDDRNYRGGHIAVEPVSRVERAIVAGSTVQPKGGSGRAAVSEIYGELCTLTYVDGTRGENIPLRILDLVADPPATPEPVTGEKHDV